MEVVKIFDINTQDKYDRIVNKVNKKIAKNLHMHKTAKKCFDILTKFDTCPACANMELNQEAHDIALGYCMNKDTIRRAKEYKQKFKMYYKKYKKYYHMKQVLIRHPCVSKFDNPSDNVKNDTFTFKRSVQNKACTNVYVEIGAE